MYSRKLHVEQSFLGQIVATHFPETKQFHAERVNRGISNVKYLVTAESLNVVVKIYLGLDRHQRARTEYELLLHLHAKSEIPVPEPISCGQSRASSALAYVVMKRLPGVGLDQVIHSLAVSELQLLGTELGSLLFCLHHTEILHSKALINDFHTGVPCHAPSHACDRQVAESARQDGILTDQEADRYVEFLAASRNSSDDGLILPSLVHGDFNLDNVVVTHNAGVSITGIIDFEHGKISRPAADFAKVSALAGPAGHRLVNAALSRYLSLASGTDLFDDAFHRQLKIAQLESDLRVAIDLKRDPFRDIFSLVTTEHQAWTQVSRLYRTLRQHCPTSEPIWVSTDAAMSFAHDLARSSTCKIRSVAAVIIDSAGTHVGSGFNELRPNDLTCWCRGSFIGSIRPTCPASHAERNAILSAKQARSSLQGLILVTTRCPCLQCARLIAREEIAAVYYADDYLDWKGFDFLIESGVHVERSRSALGGTRM